MSDIATKVEPHVSATDFSEVYGPWAVVTGAADPHGVAHALCRRLAGRHLNLVLVDHSARALVRFGDELRRRYRIDVRAVPLEPDAPGATERLVAAVDALRIGLVVAHHTASPMQEDLARRLASSGRRPMVVVAAPPRAGRCRRPATEPADLVASRTLAGLQARRAG